MAVAYYNEHDPDAAQWLRNLIALGLIAPGDVDTRSIIDVRPDDLLGYDQCHFFAGIGVWSYALRRAGWRDDQPIWTGSCPCQPFSSAGRGLGFADERHLWPAFHWLIAQCRPTFVLGEQVASAAVGPWIDAVSTDLEGLGYAVAAVAHPSAGVGAPHIRDRCYWVAVERSSGPGGLGDADSGGPLAGAGHDQTPGQGACAGAACGAGGMADSGRPGPANGFWSDADWLACRDGKWRPVESGSFPLVNGSAARVGRSGADWSRPAGREGFGHRVTRLSGYGNAINAEAAVAFIKAALPGLSHP